MSKNGFFGRVFTIFQIAVLLFSLSPNLSAQKRSLQVPQTVYSNTTPITINTVASFAPPYAATLYPSTIEVSGMTGTTTRVAVTLDTVNHIRLNDLDFLLVSPTGANYIFLADPIAGNSNAVTEDKVYTFADDAATTFPTNFEVPSGSYKPTSGDSFADYVSCARTRRAV